MAFSVLARKRDATRLSARVHRIFTATLASTITTSLAISLIVAPSAQATDELPFDPTLHSIDDSSSIWVVVNKDRRIAPKTYEPEQLKRVNSIRNPYSLKLRQPAAQALAEMARTIKAEGGGTLILNSGYRSFSYQKFLYQRMVANVGKTAAEKRVARPGFSEHQLGLAADVSAVGQGCVIRACFGSTRAGKWLAKNAHRFGFIVRYQKNQTEITGYNYEPWHLRFVGVELATEMNRLEVKTLEQFWQLPASPTYPK